MLHAKNDRLLLGLKGNLNEYEPDLLGQRSLSARYEKARRGTLIFVAPVGFVKAGDRLEKDPDRRVQEAITLVFDKVAELGSARQANGDMIWRKPTYATIHRMIENPVYGGRLRLWQDPGRAEARRGHFAIRQPPQTAR